jgi:hypothetical protein
VSRRFNIWPNIEKIKGGILQMAVNNPQSVDRSYKFIYKILGIKFHRYVYGEGENIEFIETEISNTGHRKDMAVIVDGKTIQITEFMATPLNDKKLTDFYDYNDSSRTDPAYNDFDVKTGVLTIADPNHGKTITEIDENITFHVDPMYTKGMDGWKVLSTLLNRTILQEELSDTEAIDLLILPDMDIKLPINLLMSLIIILIGKANISDKEFKNNIVLCEIRVLARFYNGDELSEMIEMLKTQTNNPEVSRIIEKYGQGFDVIYFDGKEDGKRDAAEKFLARGFDEEVISECTGISIDELKKLKRKL